VSAANKLLRYTAASAAALSMLGLSIWAWGFFGPRGFTEQKAIWATMQEVELRYRDKNIATPFLLTVPAAGYPLHLTALQTGDKNFPYSWVELSLQWKIDGSHEQFFMMGPDKPVVPCAAVQELMSREKMTVAAQHFLTANCQA
jgi:hypothetical protein